MKTIDKINYDKTLQDKVGLFEIANILRLHKNV